jgi:hypothetical protein
MSWSWARLGDDAAKTAATGPKPDPGRVEESRARQMAVRDPETFSEAVSHACRRCGAKPKPAEVGGFDREGWRREACLAAAGFGWLARVP